MTDFSFFIYECLNFVSYFIFKEFKYSIFSKSVYIRFLKTLLDNEYLGFFKRIHVMSSALSSHSTLAYTLILRLFTKHLRDIYTECEYVLDDLGLMGIVLNFPV